MKGPLQRDPWSPLLWAGLLTILVVIIGISLAGSPDVPR